MTHTRITADAFSALERLDDAVRVLRSHGTFDLALCLDDDHGSVAAVLAERICRSETEMGSRREALGALGSADAAIGDNPLIGFATMDRSTKATVRDLALLARSLVFRSWAEMRRAVMNFDIVHASYSIEAPEDALVPEPTARDESDGSIVIWAPDERVERLYIPLMAAAETGRPVRIVCKSGDLAGIAAEVVTHEDSRAALSRAAICVAASRDDPGPAIALARWEIPLCAAFTSGAHEWVDGMCSYRAWSIRSVAAALAAVLAAPSPRLFPSSPAHKSSPHLRQHDVCVTIIVRTQGGGISRATADSISRQGFESVEIIEAPGAQALREAVCSASGTYVVFVSDGDLLFRNGIGALVDALEHSGGNVAYGDALFGYLVDAPGPPTLLGYSVLERMPVSLRTMAASDEFVGTYFRVLFRKDTLVEAGFDAQLDGLFVYDAFLRMLARGTPVHVARVCGMSYRYLDGRTPGALEVPLAREYERIYARVPTEDTAVSAARKAILAHLRSYDHIGLRPPPQRLNPPRPV